MDLFTHCYRCGVMFLLRGNFFSASVRDDIPDDDITDNPKDVHAFCYTCETTLGCGDNVLKVVLKGPKG